MSVPRNRLRLLAGGLALALSLATGAEEVAVAPVVDRAGLPPLVAGAAPGNPYRGNARAVEVGRQTFNQSCARCHGADANPAGGMPAPDLRQLDRGCRRIADAGLLARCLADNDAYFRKSVEQGKRIVGVVHMPAWKAVLDAELIWALQAFVEAQAGRGR